MFYFGSSKPKSMPWIAKKAGWDYYRLSRWWQGQEPHKDKEPTLGELQQLKKAIRYAKNPLDKMEARIDREIMRRTNAKL